MKPWQRTVLILVVVLTVLSLILSACAPADKDHGTSKDGKDKAQNKDKNAGKDKEKESNHKADKILICHKTGSTKNPYVILRVPDEAAKNGHAKHPGDLIPAPAGKCPKVMPAQ